MVDAEALVMMMAMISSNSWSRQGARTEFLVPGLGFWWRLRSGTLSWKNVDPPSVSRSETFIQSGGEVERVPEAASPPPGAARGGPRLGMVWAPRGSSPSRTPARWVFG